MRKSSWWTSSTDDAAAVAEATGPASSRRAAAQARGFLWFVDADVVVHDTQRVLRYAFSEPGITAVFGSYDDQPPAKNFLSQYKNLVHHFFHHRDRCDASTFWAGCGGIRIDGFLAAGGFYLVRYTRPSIEDIELGYRLCAAEGRVLVWPASQGTHLKVWWFLNLIRTEVFCRAIRWSRLMLSQTGMVNDQATMRGRGRFVLLLHRRVVASGCSRLHRIGNVRCDRFGE